MDNSRRLLFVPPGVAAGRERECKVDDFESLSKTPLGQGAFAKVYKVRHKRSGKRLAIKVISKTRILTRGLLPQVRREVRIMYSLRHPNIVKLYNHFEDQENFYLILELCPRGTLWRKLTRYKTLTEREAAQYFREVALAVQYLHQKNPPIIHRDIKPENILLDDEDRAKLTDFGWSNFQDEERDTYCGTLEYLAPEMVNRSGHDTSVDMWNLGILLYELLAGKPPFQAKAQRELFEKIQKGKVAYPKNFPGLARDLVQRLLKTDPGQRLGIEEMFNHPWIRGNPPTRETSDFTEGVVELPTVPDSGDPIFSDNEYMIISAPSPVAVDPQSSERQQKSDNLHPRLKEKFITEQISEAKRASSKLKARVNKAEQTRQEITQRVEALRQGDDSALASEVESVQKYAKHLTGKNSRMQRYAVQLDQEIQKARYKLNTLSQGNSVYSIALARFLNAEQSLYRVQSQHQDWLQIYLQSAKSSILSKSSLFIKQVKRTVKFRTSVQYPARTLQKLLSVPSDVGREVIEKTKSEISRRQEEIKSLSEQIEAVHAVLRLKREVLELFICTN